MTLTVGTKMVRVEDGMKGEVNYLVTPSGIGCEPRIVYWDRGAQMVAKKSEVWEPEMTPPKKLTYPEMRRVAEAADAMLLALDRHQPYHWWQEHPSPAHDPALIELIIEYLKKRA